MQILMPIETNIHTLMVNFHNFGFDLLDALHSVPYLPNVNILLPVLSLNLKATLKETLVSLGLIDLFRKDNSDFAFDDNDVMEWVTLYQINFLVRTVNCETVYRTRAIITHGLYTFYPLFEVHLCIVTFGLMYG